MKNDPIANTHTIVAITYGVHSKIPLCCIVYYVTKWFPGEYFLSPKARRYWRRVVGAAPNLEYVPCPNCLRQRKFVRMHFCHRRNKGCREVTEAMKKLTKGRARK